MSNQNNHKLDTKQLTVNLFFSGLAFFLNLFISFFVAPYITKTSGAEAYGYVKLANEFTNYASLFSIALNSMASRFLMLERVRGNREEAQRYFSSISLANIVLSAIIALPSALCIVFLEKLLVIPAPLIIEVKITFSLTLANFLGNLVFSTFGTCYYLTNKLSLGSIRNAIKDVLRVSVIILLFTLSSPKISYVALGGLVAGIFVIVYNVFLTRKLVPEFRFRFHDFQWSKLWTVLCAGIWNSITKLSQIFSSGLDLMVTNLFIGPKEMGYLAVAKTVPNIVASFNSTIANIFSPNMMELYAKGNLDSLQKTTKTAIRFMCLFITIPNAILIVQGEAFFSLWVPGQPAKLLAILAVLTAINSCVTGPLAPLYQVFTITNKVKESSIVLIIYGFSSVFVTFILLNTTNLGLYAVAGVSLIGSLIVSLGYHLPFSAKYVGLRWYAFYPEIGKSIFLLITQCAIGWVINRLIPISNSWILWFLDAILLGILGLTTSFLLILNAAEKKILIEKIRAKTKRYKA